MIDCSPSAKSNISSSSSRDQPSRQNPVPTRRMVPSMLVNSSGSDSSFEILAKTTHFAQDSKSPTFPCYMTRPHTRNQRFWPRDDIMSTVEQALLPPSTDSGTDKVQKLRTFVLHGMGGVGKTEIATEFVFKHKEKFDAIFFLHADDRARLSSELVRVADMLDLDDGTDDDRAKDAVKDWLADPMKPTNEPKPRSSSFRGQADSTLDDTEFAKWLIVFDNADDPEILLDCWPDNGIGSILVTSRNPMARDDYYFGNDGHEVRELSVDEGAAFLRTMTGHEETVDAEKASRQIAARLDGHPLAIEQIGAIIRRNAFSLTGFLNIYKEEEDLEVLQDMRIARGRGYEHSIAGVWALQNLPEESLALLSVIAFLDPDCIQSRMFTDHLDTIDLASFPTSSTGFHAALTRLVQNSIVSRSLDSAELRVHRLVQEIARALMRKSHQLEAVFDTVVNLLWTDFPKITRGGVGRAQKIDRWAKCSEIFPHISRLREFYVQYTGDRKALHSRARFADLLNEGGWYQYERSNPLDTIPVVEVAQKICEESEDDHSEQLALIFGTRTWCSALTKEHEKVLSYATERLRLEQQLFQKTGKITANLAAAYNDKAAAYSMNDLSPQAFPLLDESQRLREAMPAFKPEHNFSPLHERSLAHWCQGEYDEAATCLLKAIQDRISALGENDRQSVRTGQLYYALGNVRASQAATNSAMFADSAELHQKALLHYRRTAGDNHYKTACACYRVAEHCIRNKQYPVAHDALDQAIKVFEDRSYYQQEHSRVCFLYYELYMLEGETAQAQHMLDRSVKAFNTAFPQYERTKNDLCKDDFVSLCTYDF